MIPVSHKIPIFNKVVEDIEAIHLKCVPVEYVEMSNLEFNHDWGVLWGNNIFLSFRTVNNFCPSPFPNCVYMAS